MSVKTCSELILRARKTDSCVNILKLFSAFLMFTDPGCVKSQPLHLNSGLQSERFLTETCDKVCQKLCRVLALTPESRRSE